VSGFAGSWKDQYVSLTALSKLDHVTPEQNCIGIYFHILLRLADTLHALCIAFYSLLPT